MKVLVTGASGFIGTELVKKLVKTSQVVGIDLKPAKFESRNYTHIRCDCANTVEFFKACAKFDFDVVYHLAATVGVQNFVGDAVSDSLMNNINIDNNMMRYLLVHPKTKIFFTSSSEVYGDCQGASEIAPVNIKITPRSSYAVEKLMFETFLRTRPGSVILRLFNIIGPGQDPSKGVVAKFYKAIKEGSPVTIAKGCSRSFCDVRDAIGEILAISEPGTYNIGSNLITLEIEDLFQRMTKFFGLEPPATKFVPGPSEIFDRSPNLGKILKLYNPVYKLEDTLKSFKNIL